MRTGEVPQADVFRPVVVDVRPTTDYFRGVGSISTADLVEQVPGLVRVAAERDGHPVELLTPAPRGTIVLDEQNPPQYISWSGKLKEYDPLARVPLIVRWRQFKAARQRRMAEPEISPAPEESGHAQPGLGRLLMESASVQSPAAEPAEAAAEPDTKGHRFIKFDISNFSHAVSPADLGLGPDTANPATVKAPLPSTEKPEENVDEVVMSQVGRALGAAGFVDAYQLRQEYPLQDVARAIYNTLSSYQVELRGRGFDPIIADRFSRLMEICQQNGLPMTPYSY